MELIPYTSREGRDIVLRHHNALVVRDPSSRRLEIRGLARTECPTCHQQWHARSTSPEHPLDIPGPETFVNPDYFRMLQADHKNDHPASRPPSSPIRRLTQLVPTVPTQPGPAPAVLPEGSKFQAPTTYSDETEFVSSAPAPQEGNRIRKNAFTPHYFETFFTEEGELGRGGKGVVLLVRHQIDGVQLGHFACKRVPVGDDHSWLEKVLVEVGLLAQLSHPNLVSYRHAWLEDVQLHRFGPSVACAFILQQYCNGGDLLRFVVGDQPKEVTKEELKAQRRRWSKGKPDGSDTRTDIRRLTFEEIYSLFKDIVSGLAYLHSANYVHRDLKPSNCLLHQEGPKLICLISDFGEVQPENAVRKNTGTTGTISYCAPEVLAQDTSGRFGNFTTKSDVFSLGMILYFLCFSRLPYRNANSIQEELEDIDLLRAEITQWKGFDDERRERLDLPTKLYRLLKKMLALDPMDRPSAPEVLAVMNHETTAGGPRREPRPTAPNSTHRIQSLDSPTIPSTPITEPIARNLRNNRADSPLLPTTEPPSSPPPTQDSFLDASPQSTHQNSIQKHPNAGTVAVAPRHRTASPPVADGLLRPIRRMSQDMSRSRPSPQLLMPPPTTAIGDVRNRVFIAHHRFLYACHEHAESIDFLARLCIFVVKVASLGQVCWPFMPTLSLGTTLLGLAAIDLGLPRACVLDSGSAGRTGPLSWNWKISGLFLTLHFVVLLSVSRWGVFCAVAKHGW